MHKACDASGEGYLQMRRSREPVSSVTVSVSPETVSVKSQGSALPSTAVRFDLPGVVGELDGFEFAVGLVLVVAVLRTARAGLPDAPGQPCIGRGRKPRLPT